ncbi:MAG: LamB/YcsF family protein [Arachnia sp.]
MPTSPEAAAALVAAVADRLPSAAVLADPGSLALGLAAQAGLSCLREGFADRAYRSDGSLVPRTEPGAVLASPDEVASQAVEIAVRHRAPVAGSGWARLDVDSLCVHGDTPGSVELARAVRQGLSGAGVTLQARR